eukprot:CAMPEP_0172557072 /NCGR_PEP_ID=MMETSP1067-20121228/71258_1 /TAXON_ID=265564 ORGANISM="Thalassiosira punctigera, Strain Tpunct2005C2" /NCGR_SAMPLE_ID=MMETSP1067 /ASSEMBLY_ACC=CAM_ASM_000444 /LENGTH=49 /DNA_ID= /DNA_START= /DNA_END= /DNA_ORIENTATION=
MPHPQSVLVFSHPWDGLVEGDMLGWLDGCSDGLEEGWPDGCSDGAPLGC